MAEGYNIAPLPAPKLVMMPQIGPPRLLAPGEFAPPIQVAKWDTSALAQAGEGIGELISEIFPSEQKKLEREAKKVALETSKITAAANAAEAERQLREIENPDLEIERKLRFERAKGDVGFGNDLRNAVIGRYGIKGIKAISEAQKSGHDLSTPEGQEAVFQSLSDGELPSRSSNQLDSSAPSASADINSILDQPIDTPAQGALAMQQLKELGYDSELTEKEPGAGKLGFKSYQIKIKGYTPTTNPVKEFTDAIPKDESGVPDLSDPMLTTPLPTIDPYKNISDPKAKDRAKVAAAKLADQYILDNAKNVESARDTIEQANTFLELNEKHDSPIINSLYSGPNSKWVPVIPGASVKEDVRTMSSITDKLTPRMRQGMPGAASDRDVAMFRNATIGPDKPLETNRRIGKGLIARAQDTIEEQQFKSQYAAYNGDLKGADRAWQDYLNNNPIFDPKAKQSEYKLNDSRMPWQDFFKVKNIDALVKRKLIDPAAAAQQKSQILSKYKNSSQNALNSPKLQDPEAIPSRKLSKSAENQSAQPSMITATGPNGEKIQLVNGEWVPM